MSLSKKLNAFINAAQNQKIIDEKTKQNLQNFAKNYQEKSNFSILNIIGGFGVFASLLGLILIISHNWQQFSNFTKISAFLAFLALTHLIAFKIKENFNKTAKLLETLASASIIAGIGLIAQIFHLESNNGEAFLVWFILILPLPFILQNRAIALVCAAALYCYFLASLAFDVKNLLIFLNSLAINMLLASKLMDLRSVNYFSYLKHLGAFFLIILVFLGGFSHDLFTYKTSIEPLSSKEKILILSNILMFASLLYLNFKSSKISDFKIQILFLLAVLQYLPFVISKDFALLISVIYWICWFYFAFLLIFFGIKNSSKTMVNIGSWIVILGIFARFLNLIGSMLFTGSVFILLGFTMILIAFTGEKMRKKLINKIL
jgi:uncharacterized membrane protein